jgi:hypothetical protein
LQPVRKTQTKGRWGNVIIEQLGGFVGGGTSEGHLRMEGRMAWSALSEADQRRLDALFAERKPVNANLRYRLTRDGPNGPETVEALAEAVPKALIESVKTRIE